MSRVKNELNLETLFNEYRKDVKLIFDIKAMLAKNATEVDEVFYQTQEKLDRISVLEQVLIGEKS